MSSITWLNGLLNHKIFSREEECALFARYKAGDETALAEIVRCNQKLVNSIATRYQSHGLDLEDLHQAGNEGLMAAIFRYDHTLGNKFSTFATWWIRQAIPRAIENSGKGIRLPVHVANSLQKLNNAKQTLWSESGEPSVSELAKFLGWTEAKILELERAWRLEPMSYDKKYGQDEDTSMLDYLAANQPEAVDLIVNHEKTQKVRELLEMVESHRARLIIKMRFGIWDEESNPYRKFAREDTGATLDECGQAFSITRERVRQIEKAVMSTLKRWANRKAVEFAA